MKMLIFARFLTGFALPTGQSKFTRFISFSGAPCAVVRADSEYYCESIDISMDLWYFGPFSHGFICTPPMELAACPIGPEVCFATPFGPEVK